MLPSHSLLLNMTTILTQAPHFLVPTETHKAIHSTLPERLHMLPSPCVFGLSPSPCYGAKQLWEPFPDPGAHHGQGHSLAVRKAIEGLGDRAIPACSTAAKLEGWEGSVRG